MIRVDLQARRVHPYIQQERVARGDKHVTEDTPFHGGPQLRRNPLHDFDGFRVVLNTGSGIHHVGCRCVNGKFQVEMPQRRVFQLPSDSTRHTDNIDVLCVHAVHRLRNHPFHNQC